VKKEETGRTVEKGEARIDTERKIVQKGRRRSKLGRKNRRKNYSEKKILMPKD